MKLTNEQLKNLTLSEVCERLGGIECKDSKPSYSSRKFEIDKATIAVKDADQLWIDNSTGKGGANAINLTMHVLGLDYVKACEWLRGEEFKPSKPQQAKPVEAKPVKNKYGIYPFIMPESDPSKWIYAERFLEFRGVSLAVADQAFRDGLIYTNKLGGLVFKRIYGGAVERSTSIKNEGKEGAFKYHNIGGSECGGFHIPGEGDYVMLVEGPLDALGAKGIYPEAQIICTFGVNGQNPKEIMEQLPEGKSVYVAFDNDEKGDLAAKELAKELNKFGIDSTRWKPQAKDWAEDSKAYFAEHGNPKPQRTFAEIIANTMKKPLAIPTN